MAQRSIRHLVLVLGDQLDASASAFDGFDPALDAVWMAEVAEESTHVWSGKPRIVMFLSAMRHFRDERRAAGLRVEYVELDARGNTGTLAGELARALPRLRPQRLLVTEPGDFRVQEALGEAAAAAGVTLEQRPSRHFLCSRERFAAHAKGRKQLRMEFFYREMRREHGVLLDAAGEPEGGQWNFDSDNRGSFKKGGPEGLRPPRAFPPDATTRAVIELVERQFGAHPGKLDAFDWPVTAAAAKQALDDFVAHRLPQFGEFQDAMWTAEPWLFHSRLSAAMNLGLLDPRTVIAATEKAYRQGKVALASAEGFIRQILGWREYVRGIYWQFMPQYLERNALAAVEPLPAFYWTGEVPMQCLQQALRQTLDLGYAHHIQRLMVTGLYSLLLGVRPQETHAWYLAVYVDAVEWVELPNTLGMSQYGDGGVMASKPYVATGNYIKRMSNYCSGCRFDPAQSTGERACPFTTLYWDFLLRHQKSLASNQRMSLQLKNLARLDAKARKLIQGQAAAIRANGGVPPNG
jgi:deoxyribodipyrimidine photolyase-related protein